MKFNYKIAIKPVFDIMAGLAALLALTPFFFLVAVSIRLDSRGPIFYVQDRLGKNGKIFKLFKFRSMTHRPDRKPGEAGELITNVNAEITRVGEIIRRLKIDELPQLINILKGDLSLVGPRPCLPELQKKFDENGRSRLLVKPGCTGLAQIHGNIHLPWPERWKYDAYYAENISFLSDIEIIAKTFRIIFVGEDKFSMSFATFLQKATYKHKG